MLLVMLTEQATILPGVSQDLPVADSLVGQSIASLPPLSVIIDSALSTNAMVRLRNLDINSKEFNLKSQNATWFRNIGIQADARYGTFDNFSTNTNEGQTPSTLATRNSQMNYGVGAFVKFPFYDLVNRKNQLKMARIELSQAQTMAEAQRDEVRQMVIRQFNDVLLKQRLLEIKSKNLGTARINLAIVQKQFQNRNIDIGEYARIEEIAGRAEADFEAARSEYITAFMILEEIAGFKF